MNLNLKTQQQINFSDIVANNAMNRERGFSGINSYEKELRFSLGDFFERELQTQSCVTWLDLCCGKGYALQEAASKFADLAVCGIDLVGDFVHVAGGKFIVGSLPEALPESTFDLITCVHGLHYVVDKLGFIHDAAKLLTPNGIFLGNLDHRNIKSSSGKTLRGIVKLLSTSPSKYSGNVLRISQPIEKFPYELIGGDDQAGPNYTHQPVIDSYYAPLEKINKTRQHLEK
ncbi:class I SAM-dependent methyltransferase [Candidatus Uabimicrobium sp. HlEnr_7]|uniref:class I SAM-dependent methyltransferase n=1 Tax=Candidatus Uabimicrobium helgolandensis TaxID=3095367 RepID=UPI003556E4B8